ncbi:MAG: LPXTG cell wall anchor domain-containing protein [Clostridiales bacterium]|nr:LPXTG cell wall anchor domain-containing protein [Clostridiales bacterium]
MKMNISKHLLLAALFTVLLLCITMSAALAGPATQVVIANHPLSVSQPYLLNSGSYGNPSNWNVHFDTSTSPAPTLRLKNASFNTMTNASGELSVVVVNGGDIIVELEGTNYLYYSGGSGINMNGIFCPNGSVTITESGASGNLTISILNGASGYTTAGIRNHNEISIQGGTIDISTQGMYSYGVFTEQQVSVSGGQVSLAVPVGSTYVAGVRADTAFSLSGGTVSATVYGFGGSSGALYSTEVSITGGSGEFDGLGSAFGLFFPPGSTSEDMAVTGGQVIFTSANQAALLDATSPYPSLSVSGDILVASISDGTGKTTWAPAMGQLFSNYSFHYVEMLGESEEPPLPQTGDAGRPWLWLGIGFAAVFVGAGVFWIFRKRYAKTA